MADGEVVCTVQVRYWDPQPFSRPTHVEALEYHNHDIPRRKDSLIAECVTQATTHTLPKKK